MLDYASGCFVAYIVLTCTVLVDVTIPGIVYLREANSAGSSVEPLARLYEGTSREVSAGFERILCCRSRPARPERYRAAGSWQRPGNVRKYGARVEQTCQ